MAPSLEGIIRPDVPEDTFHKLTPPELPRTSRSERAQYNTIGGEDPSHNTLTRLQPGGMVDILHSIPMNLQGVVIYCEGAKDEDHPRLFAPISISRMEAAYHPPDHPYSIPSLIGLPIWMRPHNHDPTIDRSNPVATWLLAVGNPEDLDFGRVEKKWLDSAVVMRRDGEALLPQHLEVLCFYCKFVFEEVLGKETKEEPGLAEDPELRQMQVRTFWKLVSRRGFMGYYEKYRSKKSTYDDEWRALPSPINDSSVDSSTRLANGLMNGDHKEVGRVTWAKGYTEEEEEEPAPRRSGRKTRVPSSLLEDLALANSPTDDEPRGRTNDRTLRSSSPLEYDARRGRAGNRQWFQET